MLQIKIVRLFFILIVVAIIIESLFIINFHPVALNLKNNFGQDQVISQTDHIITPLSFRYLLGLNKGALQSVIITNTYKGIVRNVFDNPGSYYGFVYNKAISIDGEKGFNVITLNAESIKSLEIMASSSNTISFSDLKKGDKVTIIEEVDLTQDQPQSKQKVKIIKEL